MKTIDVQLKNNEYKIIVGKNILSQAGNFVNPLGIGRDAVIITNPVVAKYYGKSIISGLRKCQLTACLLTVPDGEKSKSAKFAIQLLEKIARYDVGKKIFILALGGGVIGDLSGFVAAVYKRGIPYLQVPTTLLAQIDSAIGGKVAIDLSVGKNLVGAFYQPKMVISDIAALSTLNVRQIRNGLAEAVKYGIICDAKFFDYIESHIDKIFELDPEVLTEIVLVCSKIKANIVMRDEKETKGMRTILNFGHTVGHAIEAAGSYSNYHHGEAIALGMRVAADISYRLGFLDKESVRRINSLLSRLGLPQRIKKIAFHQIFKFMAHDKKFRAGKNRFILATKIGSVKVVEGVPPNIIKTAIRAYFN